MKLHQHLASQDNLFTAYDSHFIEINKTPYYQSVIVSKDQVVVWQVQSLAQLQVSDFDSLLAEKPEVVILGCGATQHFPSREIFHYFHQRHVGLEVMTTPAACRTYNFLMTEGRHVVAAVLL